jgi:hypothetical protein
VFYNILCVYVPHMVSCFMFVRDLLNMSLESSRLSLSGNINTNHSNAASVAGSSSRVPVSATSCSHAQRQGPASHNVWRKVSTGEECY